MGDYTEVLAATLDKRTYLKRDICWSAFRVFGRNGDGKISQEELKAVLGDEGIVDALGKSLIELLMGEVDSNGDGFIDFDEFMAMMKKQEASEAQQQATEA